MILCHFMPFTWASTTTEIYAIDPMIVLRAVGPTDPSTWSTAVSNKLCVDYHYPDSKVHGANMGPTWDLSAPDGQHVGPMNPVIRESTETFEGMSCVSMRGLLAHNLKNYLFPLAIVVIQFVIWLIFYALYYGLITQGIFVMCTPIYIRNKCSNFIKRHILTDISSGCEPQDLTQRSAIMNWKRLKNYNRYLKFRWSMALHGVTVTGVLKPTRGMT